MDGYYCLSAVSHHELLVHIHFHLWNSLVPGPGMRGYVVGQAGLSVPVKRALYTLCLAREELKDICMGGLRSCPLKEVFIPHAHLRHISIKSKAFPLANNSRICVSQKYWSPSPDATYLIPRPHSECISLPMLGLVQDSLVLEQD